MPTFTVTSRPDEPDELELDPSDVPFAGKFGRRQTGTAVLETDAEVLAAIAFSPDRVEPDCCRIRYLAVSRGQQGKGLAGTLTESFVAWALDDRYERIRITVLNPYAVTALTRIGFGVTDDTGPSGGVVLAYPPVDTRPVVDAMITLASADLSNEQQRYVQRYLDEADTAAEPL